MFRHLPGQVASAAGFKAGYTSPEFEKVLSNKTHAGISLQRHGSYVQNTITLPFQQLIQLLFKENLIYTKADAYLLPLTWSYDSSQLVFHANGCLCYQLNSPC